MYPIEKGIPLPPSGFNTAGAPEKYPFRSMEVGDSFAVPYEQSEKKKIRSRVESAKYAAKKRTGNSYAVRGTPGIIRVWRTA